jgi:predicted nucleic acid-binding protein
VPVHDRSSTSPGRGSGKGTWPSSARTAASTGPGLVVLVDTSVWIEVFRRPSRITLERAVDFDDVVTCLPVVQEVLQGFRDEAAFARARVALESLPTVDDPMPRELFVQAAELYRAGRRAGLTVRSGVDCLIAASAIRHQLEVLHHDRDYDAIARISTLRSRQIKFR